MDFLLWFYSLLFVGVLILPFLIFYFKFSEETSPFGKDEEANLRPLYEKKQNLVDSLKDIQSDFDSGKLTEQEYQNQSIPLLADLELTDKELSTMEKTSTHFVTPKIITNWTCASCGSFVTVPNAKSCPNCGSARLA